MPIDPPCQIHRTCSIICRNLTLLPITPNGSVWVRLPALYPLVIEQIQYTLNIAIIPFFSHELIGLLRSVFSNEIAAPLVSLLWPGLLLVILGQFCFIGTIATLVISSRLRKFPMELEEAAMDLGASRWGAILSITIPYLFPALFSAGVLAVLLSFENFATTLFLVGSESTLPIFYFQGCDFLLHQRSTP